MADHNRDQMTPTFAPHIVTRYHLAQERYRKTGARFTLEASSRYPLTRGGLTNHRRLISMTLGKDRCYRQ